MKSRILGCLAAAMLGAAVVAVTPAMAFRGGFGGGGFHGGGFGGFRGGGFGGFHGAFRGPMFMGRSAFIPGAGRFGHAPFAGRHFAANRFNNPVFSRNRFFHNRFFPFRHRFFRNNFFFVGAPFAVGWDWPYYGYD